MFQNKVEQIGKIPFRIINFVLKKINQNVIEIKKFWEGKHKKKINIIDMYDNSNFYLKVLFWVLCQSLFWY